MAPYTLKRILRRPLLLVFSIVLSGVFCFFLCYLSDYLEEQRRELTQVQDSYDVACVVSDLQGSRTTGLRMEQPYYDFVTHPAYEFLPYIRDVQITKEFWYTPQPEPWETQGDEDPRHMIALNAPACAHPLNESQGGSVIYLTDDFYTSDQPQCIVPETLYRQIAAKSGRSESEEISEGLFLKVNIKDPTYDVPDTLFQELAITGVYQGVWEAVYIPLAYGERLMMEISDQRSCDSIRFCAADNRRLAELAQAASKGFTAVDMMGGESIYSYALTIYDEQYRSTVSTLEQNIRRTEYLLPPMLILSVGLGAIIGFLAARNESRSYALMRTVGLTRRQLFFSIAAERLIPAAAGCVIAAAAARMLLPPLLYLACYLLGGCAAAIRPVGMRPTVILREQE